MPNRRFSRFPTSARSAPLLLGLLLLLSRSASHAQITFTKITDTAASPPGTGNSFLGFYPPQIHRGWVVFGGFVRDPGGFTYGIYGWTNGILSTLVDPQTPHPELPGLFFENSGIPGDDSFAIEGGVLVFAHQQRLNQAGVFQWSNGVISTLVWTNDSFGPLGRYVGGAVIGRSQGTNLVATRFGLPRSGLVTVPGDGSAIAYNFSDDLPGLTAAYKDVGPAAFDLGRLVFSASTPSLSVLYARTNGGFRSLADNTTQVPAWPAPLASFAQVAIDGDGVLFAAGSADSRAGLFRMNLDGSGLTQLLDTQTVLPNGKSLAIPSLENWHFGAQNGDVVFWAGDPFNEHGLYLWRAGTITRIISNAGDVLEGKRVLEIQPLGRGCLSDGGFAFVARTSDGRKGVFLAQLPPPSAGPLEGQFAQTLAPQILAGPFSLLAWLERTEEGRRLIRLYSQHAAELLKLALANPALGQKTVTTLTEFLPGLNQFLAGQGGEVTITAGQIGLLNEVWDGFAAGATPKLKAALQTERTRFNGFQDFAGKSFADWGTLLAIGTPTTPFVTLSRPGRTHSVFQAEANRVPGNYRLQRAAPQLPLLWTDAPGADIRLLDNRVEVKDAQASGDAFIYRLLLGE